ncbi:MAG: type II toxin-antitoxin system PemK/MazF family toxin [Candidatus Paceibacterota bacterium]
MTKKAEKELFFKWNKLKIEINNKSKINFYFYEREVWWASLGKNIGFEQNGKNKTFERPVLIIKKFNKNVLWIIPFTSTLKSNKYYHNLKHNKESYSLILSQIRLISSKRLTRKIRRVPKKEFKIIKDKLKNFL